MAGDETERDEGVPATTGGRFTRFFKSREGKLLVLGTVLISLFLLIRRIGAQGTKQIDLDGLPHVDPTGASTPGSLPIVPPPNPAIPVNVPTGGGGGIGGGISSAGDGASHHPFISYTPPPPPHPALTGGGSHQAGLNGLTPVGLEPGTVVPPGDLTPHRASAYVPHPIADHPAAPTHPAVQSLQAAAQAAVLRLRAGRGVQYQ